MASLRRSSVVPYSTEEAERGIHAQGGKRTWGLLEVFVSFGFFARCRTLSFVYCLMYLIAPELEMDEDSCYR